MPKTELFEIERDNDTLVLTPTANLSELENMDAVTQEIYDALSDRTIKNLVMDFHKTDYFGSTTLGFFVHLWKMMQERGGRMAFCNLSEHEKEILEITKLDTYWELCPSREEAMKSVQISKPPA